MWDVLFVIAIILLIRYLFGGSSQSAVVPAAGVGVYSFIPHMTISNNRFSFLLVHCRSSTK